MTRRLASDLFIITASACSATPDRDGAVLDDPLLPDGGSNHHLPDAEADADDLDASHEEDVFVPNDADRSDHGGQCMEDETCVALLSPGLCERAICENGRCIKEDLPDGTGCDDGDACTEGDVCKSGKCSYSSYNPNAPGCLQEPDRGSLRFTEIMGNPASDVDPIEGQWFEMEADASYRLKGLKLVYYEWDGETMPTSPSFPVVDTIEAEHGEERMIFLRSQDTTKNRWGLSAWGYSKIQFSKTRNARLMLVASSWDGSFPVPDSLVFADILLEAGTFSDEYKGRSWQRSADPANDTAFCHTPTEEIHEYWDGNFATPFKRNVECP